MPPDPNVESQKLRTEAGPWATTPNGAPFPLRSWPPDTAVDIQHLAEWVDPLNWTVTTTPASNGFDLRFGSIRLQGQQKAYSLDAGGYATATFATPFSVIYGILFAQMTETQTACIFQTANAGLLVGSCRFRCIKHDGTALASVSVYVAWIAWGAP